MPLNLTDIDTDLCRYMASLDEMTVLAVLSR